MCVLTFAGQRKYGVSKFDFREQFFFDVRNFLCPQILQKF